jgi:microcystin-dependent protein|tara:strand:- start:4795 stop:6879 length:2085 start_codon:yes stop_codon:yes gene_type:complete
MPYTINYTDVANAKGTITVEDGTINRETSLGFPGRNTTAYGAVVAENFLHLLENFANTSEPTNPSEGQLWWDKNAGQDVLKVYNGTNWLPSSGITKSIDTPAYAQTGDLWVDTDNQQLYLFTGGGWILVGPSFSEGLASGVKAESITAQDNLAYTILRIEVSGATVGIISGSDASFVPKTTIAGFPQINPGFNVISRDTDSDGLSNYKFFGTAEKAESLIVNNTVVAAGDFLRGNTTSTTTFPLNVQNNQGINYGVNAELTVGVEGTAGIIQHNVGGSNIDLRVRNSNQTKTVIRVDSNLRVGVNTEAPEEALDVVGSIQTSANLLVNGTTQSTTINNGALIVRGGAAVKQNLNVGGATTLNNLLTTQSVVPDDNNIRDIGANLNRYRAIYATTITAGNVFGTLTGKLVGSSTQSNKLTDRTTFIMEGDVTTIVPVSFDGSFQDPSFNNGDGIAAGEQPLIKKFRTEISNNFINAKPPISDVNGSDLILVDDRNSQAQGLKYTTKNDFLKTIPRMPAGVILPFGGVNVPAGWLLCDGRELIINDWSELFGAISYNFKASSSSTPGQFALPDFRGRMPMGADNMGGTPANVVLAASADVMGVSDGSEEITLSVNQLPDHVHDLQDSDQNQYYVYQDRQDPTADSNVEQVSGPNEANSAQRLLNSGGIESSQPLGQAINIMPPTVTINYIIYSGRE